MNEEPLSEKLADAIATGSPLRQIVSTLRDYKRLGVTRHEVQDALESLRGQSPDEATEDRILEVLDIVSGFCSPDMTVW